MLCAIFGHRPADPQTNPRLQLVGGTAYACERCGVLFMQKRGLTTN